MSAAPALRRVLLPALAILLAPLAASAAEPAAWDQARTTAIATQLAAACDAFQQAVEKQPGTMDVGSGSAAEGFDMTRSARGLREQSRALADHLGKGKGRDATHDEYKSLREIADDVEQSAQRSRLDDPTMAAWAKVADELRQLAPYYEAEAR